MTIISVTFSSNICWTCDYNIREIYILTYVGHMTKISVTFNIYICWTCDYNIRDIKIFTYVGPVTTTSVTSKHLRMLHL